MTIRISAEGIGAECARRAEERGVHFQKPQGRERCASATDCRNVPTRVQRQPAAARAPRVRGSPCGVGTLFGRPRLSGRLRAALECRADGDTSLWRRFRLTAGFDGEAGGFRRPKAVSGQRWMPMFGMLNRPGYGPSILAVREGDWRSERVEEVREARLPDSGTSHSVARYG